MASMKLIYKASREAIALEKRGMSAWQAKMQVVEKYGLSLAMQSLQNTIRKLKQEEDR